MHDELFEAADSRAVWSLYWENDGAFFKPNSDSDRHYTNGARIVYSAPDAWADEFARWLPMAPMTGEALETAAFYSIGHEIYTPDHVANPAARPPDDRPFAGWLYGSVGIERASDRVADRLDLKIGVIGPLSGAEKFQKNAHDWFDPDRPPRGWDDQLGNRFAIDLDVNRRWKFDLDHDESDFVDIELIPEAGFTMGTVHRHLMAGATLRVGSPFLPRDFGPGRLNAPSTAVGFPRGPAGVNQELAWQIFARVEGRAVFHNELLERVEEEPFFGMVQVGVSLVFARNLTLGYSQTFMSKEFETQHGGDAFGAITVAWSYAY